MKKKALGTYDIAKICHVAPITVGRWIEEGKIPFFTTGGGHRRVWDEDLAKFLRAHNYPLPKDLLSSAKHLILVVDDDALTRKYMHRAIQKNIPDAEVQEATNGFEAGEMITTLMPALVILDIRLPGLDGYDVCARIRKNKTLKSVKILAITGVGGEDTQKKILKAGADAFMEKSSDLAGLIKLITKLLKA